MSDKCQRPVPECGSTIHYSDGMSICHLPDGHNTLHKYERVTIPCWPIGATKGMTMPDDNKPTLSTAKSAGGWLLVLHEPGKADLTFFTEDERLLAFWNACRKVVDYQDSLLWYAGGHEMNYVRGEREKLELGRK